MRFRILGSSSSGNCSFIQTPQARVLIDAGFSGKRIGEMLAGIGVHLDEIDAVFITHEHSDHICGLRALSKLPRLKVFANYATAQAIRPQICRPVNWQVFESGTSFQFADLQVTAFPIPHDAYDPVGFVFKTGTGGDLFDPVRSVAWLTDLGHIPANVRERVRGCDVLVLEANHDVELLDNDPVRPFSLKQRIKGRHGHLSNSAALEFLQTVERPAWQHVFLAHLSRECNDPALVRRLFGTTMQGVRNCPITVVDPEGGCGETVTLGGSLSADLK